MVTESVMPWTPMLEDPSLTISLNGAWAVWRRPFDADEAALAAPARDDAAWERVVQPGKVFYADPEAEGGAVPDWNRVTLTHIDPDDGAMLRREVAIPPDWRGRRVFARFDAVYPACRLYVNGRLLAEHMSGLTPLTVDVTDHVEPGATALVAVRLIRRHRFVQMDMVRHALEFGGLAQPACLYAVEPCHVADYHIVSALDAALTTGELSGTVSLRNADAAAAAATLRVTLTAPDGNLVACREIAADIPGGAVRELDVRLNVERPVLWNDEFPHCYTVGIDLAVSGCPDQRIRYRTGFRRLDLSPSGPRLNGQFVKFRGVNHLTFHPEHGMYTPEPWLRRNLTLMKRANVNAIRTHFLGPRCLADLCDELGIYLMQELPIDWGTDYIHDPEWAPPALLRIEGGVRRDRHHPSIVVWSVGNENMPKTQAVAEAGWAHLRQYEQRVKTLDPSRATMFPPPGPANRIDGIIELRVGDIADTHYSFHHIKRFLKDGAVDNPNSWDADMARHTREWALQRGWSGVWFSSEYGIFNAMPDLLHSPGCSIITDVPEDLLSDKSTFLAFEERLAREWGCMRDEPSCLGGAYFPWLCCGAGRGPDGNPWGWTRWGEDADWGVVTADLLPKPFFWALRVLFSPVWFPRVVTWRPGDGDIRFTVQNQYNAIDLKDCTLRVQQNRAARYGTMMRAFKDVAIAGAPGATADVVIPLEPTARAVLDEGGAALVRCTLLDPGGFRPITAEIRVIPAEAPAAAESALAMPVGPDAVL